MELLRPFGSSPVIVEDFVNGQILLGTEDETEDIHTFFRNS